MKFKIINIFFLISFIFTFNQCKIPEINSETIPEGSSKINVKIKVKVDANPGNAPVVNPPPNPGNAPVVNPPDDDCSGFPDERYFNADAIKIIRDSDRSKNAANKNQLAKETRKNLLNAKNCQERSTIYNKIINMNPLIKRFPLITNDTKKNDVNDRISEIMRPFHNDQHAFYQDNVSLQFLGTDEDDDEKFIYYKKKYEEIISTIDVSELKDIKKIMKKACDYFIQPKGNTYAKKILSFESSSHHESYYYKEFKTIIDNFNSSNIINSTINEINIFANDKNNTPENIRNQIATKIATWNAKKNQLEEDIRNIKNEINTLINTIPENSICYESYAKSIHTKARQERRRITSADKNQIKENIKNGDFIASFDKYIEIAKIIGKNIGEKYLGYEKIFTGLINDLSKLIKDFKTEKEKEYLLLMDVINF